ncbi:MAG TPA: hypothetical protein VL048_03765 [Xanthobacteraceae bacterium]|nr:hypothetical protein [Xanthobacteraceae bacterium]
MDIDYGFQSEIQSACARAGVLPTAIADFVADASAYKFGRDEIGKYIDQMRVERPHRFAMQTDFDAELATKAFVARNMTAQSQLYRTVGPQRFDELKKMYANGVPESVKKLKPNADHARNPWSSEHADPKTGRYTARAMTLQSNLVRSIGAAKAAEIAAAVGAKIGDVRPPKAA